MATKDIKHRITLEGEKEYNNAIKEAKRNLKTLQSQLKAETAEMGRNATEQQKNEARTKSLKQQIAEQEKVVKTLREALAQAKIQYADNAEEIARWEQRLNNARTTLANMQNDLEGVGSGLKTVSNDAAQATVATKSMADALGNVGSAGESAAGAIEGIFEGIISTVTDAVEQLWSLISSTAAKAKNWNDIAGYWNTSAQNIQMYSHAVEGAGESFEDLQNAVTRLVLGGKGKKITELIGISDENYEDKWAYAMAIMDQLHRMQEEGKDLTPIYEEIFGEKRATKVMDLVNAWDKVQELLPQFNGNESGYGMTDKGLETMDALATKIATVQEKWEGLKERVAEGFGSVTLDLITHVEGTLDGIADYLNAKDDAEKEAALQKIRTNVEAFFRKLGEIIRESIHIMAEVGGELQESDDPLASAIGTILVKLSEALQWIVDNAEAVKTALRAIFDFWLLMKLGAIAGKLGSIIGQIKTIKAFKGISLLGSGKGTGTGTETGTGAETAAAAGAGGGFWAKAKSGVAGFWASLKTGLATAIPMAATEAAVIAAAAAPAIVAQKHNEAQWVAEMDFRTSTAEKIEEKNGGPNENTFWAKLAAAALGPRTNADGTFAKDITGLFLNMNPTDEMDKLLMDLQARQNQEKAQLHNDIEQYAPITAGNDTWNLLQRYWEKQDLDPFEVAELLSNVTDALLKAEEARANQAEESANKVETLEAATVEEAAEAQAQAETAVEAADAALQAAMDAAAAQEAQAAARAEMEAEIEEARRKEAEAIAEAKRKEEEFRAAQRERMMMDEVGRQEEEAYIQGDIQNYQAEERRQMEAELEAWRQKIEEDLRAALEAELEAEREKQRKNADAQFVRLSNKALGINHPAGGDFAPTGTGQPTDEMDDLLMGLKSRQNQQKAELYNAIEQFAPITAGNDTWNLLQRYWERQDLDPFEVDALLTNISSALEQALEAAAKREAEKRVGDSGLPTVRGTLEESREIEASAEGAVRSMTDGLREMEEAYQDWWDAYRKSEGGGEDEVSAEEEAFWYLQDIFGDKFGEIWDNILQKLDETENGKGMEDLPSSWWLNPYYWQTGGQSGGLTGDDVQTFRGLPGQLSAAAQSGVAKGISGIKVTLDGRAVGTLVAPYVSEMIARDIDG